MRGTVNTFFRGSIPLDAFYWIIFPLALLLLQCLASATQPKDRLRSRSAYPSVMLMPSFAGKASSRKRLASQALSNAGASQGIEMG
jgi:hypothetical protein